MPAPVTPTAARPSFFRRALRQMFARSASPTRGPDPGGDYRGGDMTRATPPTGGSAMLPPALRRIAWLHVPLSSLLKAEGDRGGPGSHGGTYYINEHGHVVYGERPTGRIQYASKDIANEGRTRSGRAVPKMIDQAENPDRKRFALHPAMEHWTSDDHADAAKIHERAKRELWRTGANRWARPGNLTGADRAAQYHVNMEKLHRARRDELRRRDAMRHQAEVQAEGQRQLAEEHHAIVENPSNVNAPRVRLFGRTEAELQSRVADFSKRGYRPVGEAPPKAAAPTAPSPEPSKADSALRKAEDVQNPGSRGGKYYFKLPWGRG